MLGDDEGPLARFLDGQSQFLRGQYDQWERTGFISNHVFISAYNYLKAFRDAYTREWAHAREDHYDHFLACVSFTVAELERYLAV